MMLGATTVPERVDDSLSRFHAGDRATLERVYADHFAVVEAAISPLLGASDREAIIHDVFAGLIARAEVRTSFRGGSLSAWLCHMARNRAIDLLRRRQREARVLATLADDIHDEPVAEDVRAEARRALAAFRAELPVAWLSVFDACFVRQLSQREAGRELGIARTTLAYRALQIRRRLRTFILEGRHD
jgi:RNA polymerase sigma-70 factor (ECF subfamily)